MIWPAFLIGVVGSLHCIGMCGPIALALPVPQDKNRFVGIMLYNLGRITTYGLLGLLFGSFGSLFIMAGLQQFLSVTAGITLLIIFLLSVTKHSNSFFVGWLNKIISPLKNQMRIYLKEYSFLSLFVIGILNGLLPCGLVYLSIIGAVTTGSSIDGAAYMIVFGMGTIPAMFLVGFWGSKISFEWRFKVSRFIPYMIGILAVMFILRGMNLGIPYLSPKISSEKLMTSQCCSK
jgi:uncharacterized protein